MHENRAQYILVLTDLADTKRKTLPQFSAPHGEVHVLILVIPADRQDTILTLGKPLSASEQFEARLPQLHDMAPWALAAPYFAHNRGVVYVGDGSLLTASCRRVPESKFRKHGTAGTRHCGEYAEIRLCYWTGAMTS